MSGWNNSLLTSPVLWGLVLAVPPLIVALYFLKLKRAPLEVPSTYLWRKSIEDLHVNSLWQRLRQSLLLFLQLLLILLAILALLNPSFADRQLSGDRFIFLIDNSASMGATDIEPNRLEFVKRQVASLIDEMKSGEEAMIVSFSNGAQVEQLYTADRKELHRRLERIELSDRSTSIHDALRIASGLANPGRSAFETSDQQVAEALPATLYIFSDGKFPDVEGFSLGTLEPRYYRVGADRPANVGIVAFEARRNEEKLDMVEAFARVENFGAQDASVEVSLYQDDNLRDADRVDVPAGEAKGIMFSLGDVDTGVLRLEAETGDALAIDDTAWATIELPSRIRLLLLTLGNEPLEFALETLRAQQLADTTTRTPSYLTLPEYAQRAAAGTYDLIIFDRCVPTDPQDDTKPGPMPQSNTLFIGRLPPGDAWSAEEKADVPQIIDIQRSHPLMQLIEMGDVLLMQGTPLKPPPGSTVLIDTSAGAVFAIAPREGVEDAVLAFAIWGEDDLDTNWAVRPSFPVFVMNLLQYISKTQGSRTAGGVRPGTPVALRTDAPLEKVTVETPAGDKFDVPRGKQNMYHFADTAKVGVYRVHEKDAPGAQNFAVNLFDSAESDIRPRPEDAIKIGYVKVEGGEDWEPARRDFWKLLLVAALVVLLFEWYIFNRRVYL